MFGKKKNKQSKSKTKKKGGFFHNADNDKLSSVIDETTPNSVLDIFDAEPKLSATVNGETKYIGLLLNADDSKIGGINKNRRKDDTIGDLIEAINQDRLQVYAPAELLDENKLIIIPTLKTLATMSEYNVLTNDNLKYKIALIATNGNIGLTQATINFDEMQRFMNDPDVGGDDLLSDKKVVENKEPDNLPQSNTNQNNIASQGDNNNEDDSGDDPLSALTDGLSDEVANSNQQQNSSNTGTDGIDDADIEDDLDDQSDDKQDSAPVNNEPKSANNQNTANDSMPFGDSPVQDDAQPQSADLTNQAPVENQSDSADIANGISDDVTEQEQVNASNQNNNDLDWSGDDSENYDDYSDDSDQTDNSDDTVISPEDTYKAITRKFYSNDLDLKISTEPIDDLLNADNKFVPFDEDRGDGYLNQYLNQMAKEANQQLKTEHETHKSIVRNMYYDLVTKSAEDLTSQLDENDDATDFGRRKTSIISSKNQREDSDEFNKAVDEKKKKIEDEFNARAKKDGERAAQQAEASYKERFGGELDAKLANVETDMHNDIEHWYNEAMKEMHTDQKTQAAALWDNMESIAIGKALNRYKALRKQEAQHESNWRKKMRDFANNHRKEAVAHDDLMKRELDQDKRSKEIKERYERQISQLEADNKERLEQSQKRLADLQKQHELDLANVKTQVEAENSAKHAREIADLKLANDKQVSQLQLDLQDRSSQVNSYKLEAESEKIKNKSLQTKLDTLDERKSQELSEKYKSQYNGQIEALKTNSQFLKEQSKERASQIKAVKHSKVISNVAIALFSVVLSSGATFGVMSMVNQNHTQANSNTNSSTITRSEAQDMIESAKRNQQQQDQASQQKAIDDALDKFKKEQNDSQRKQSANNNGNVQNQSYQPNGSGSGNASSAQNGNN